MHELIDWLLTTMNALGYPGIFILMAMESSIIPVPSELVMPPAGYLAQQGSMNIWLAILMGTVGSLVGAYANYFASHYLGRPLVLKYGKYVWITEEKFVKVERFFLRHGEISTFIGRLLPVVRHLISIPAGIAGMNHFRFSLYTLVGAGHLVHHSCLDRLLYRQGTGADHAVLPSGGDRCRSFLRNPGCGLCLAA